MQRAEEVKRVFQRCQTARHLHAAGGLNHVLVPANPTNDPKTCTTWKRVDNPEEVQSTIQQRNQEHFGQSRNCTLTTPPLDFTMKFTATCPQADAILDGTFLQPTSQPNLLNLSDTQSHHSSQHSQAHSCERDPPSTDENDTPDNPSHSPLHLQRADLPELVSALIDSFQYKAIPNTIQPHITEAEYKAKLKAWDERTSTSPFSNMHLGHLKAYWAEHTLPERSKEAQELEDKRREILQGHLSLLNYALHFGYPFSSWKSIVNTMLEKDPGFPKIHRLRVIHLYEADYNLILGVKWRQVLQHTCASQHINDGCYGSQPGKEATDAVVIRELEYELSRPTRKPSIHFDNDATSCYDRIPCFLANLASRKYGMHRKVCIVQGRTLEEAKYFLKTKLGVSDDFIQHCEAHPIFGTGQGSGNSPTYWLFISSTLFDLFDTRAKGSLFETPDKSLSVEIKAIGFVDDVRNSINAFLNNSITLEQLVRLATCNSQLWHDILTACNQALELPKCGYHVLSYQFQPTDEPSLIEDPECQLTLQDHNAQPLTIS